MNNIMALMFKIKAPLPTDTIVLHCDDCSTNIPLSLNGIFQVDRQLDMTLHNIVNDQVKLEINKHQEKCCSTISVHPILGMPENLLITFPPSSLNYITDITVHDTSYRLEMIVQQENTEQIIFTLYQRNDIIEKLFSEIIQVNFDAFLDIEEKGEELCSDEEIVYDDDTVHQHQHELKRMFGGGRKIDDPYNYECLWCPKEIIENGKRGRYMELKNYRDHFRKFHMSVEGGSILMSEFMAKATRKEPTWFCANCRRRSGLANMVRHKAICHGIHFHHGSTSTDNSHQTRQPARPANENDTNSDDHFDKHDGIRKYKRILPPQKLDSSSEEEIDGDLLNQDCASSKKTKNDLLSKHLIVVKSTVSKKAKVNDVLLFNEPDDEIYISSPEKSPEHINIEVKLEEDIQLGEQADIEEDKAGPSDSCENIMENNKWWLKLSDDKHFAIEDGCPEIFCEKDTEDFKKNTTKHWKIHMAAKQELDKNMIEAESEEAQTRQFSTIRDSPFLIKYTEFVQSFSAKDVLHIFSEEYDNIDLPKGAKSSTATQYANRIIELFKFMSIQYDSFHLDWMIDFSGSIEKIYPDLTKSHDIFIPTINDLRDFIQTFKYGSNPAANCGIRIFALKKMMEFIIQQVKDHEHVFIGSIIDKSRTVECLVQRLKNLNESICPDGTIKHLSTASNKSHKRSIVEQMAKCPGRSMESIMKGVQDYVQSEEYNNQRTNLIELACKKTKLPTPQEYMNATNWLLEQLICLGGNRPCALLGITIKDWNDRKPGYCPFFQTEQNNLVCDDQEHDSRKVLKNPYTKPQGEAAIEPTGFIVNTETDKIAVSVNQPCYIWFPNAIVDLINDHSLMAQKILPKSVDIYHPKTRLFLNSLGNPITKIECKHFKNYIGLPITCYDFRRSLSTFCLDSKNETVRNAEPSILRHREETGFAYYYQKHGEKVEYVSIQYALKHGLVKASVQMVDEYCSSLRKGAMNEEWELSQKRTDRALQYNQDILEKRKQGLQNARRKGERNWILPNDYDAFMEGIEEAIRLEKQRLALGQENGPFRNLLNYVPGAKGAGVFPPNRVWKVDMYRVLYGLIGNKGDAMRQAELNVYDGVPFASGYTGRKKVHDGLKDTLSKRTPSQLTEDWIVANYWRDKIRREAVKICAGKWLPLRFIFSTNEFLYHLQKCKVKEEAQFE